MEKMIKMMAMAIACVAMCGTAAAAPTGATRRQAGRPHEARQTVIQAPKGAQKAAKAAPVRNNRPAPQVAQRKGPARESRAVRGLEAPRREGTPGTMGRDYCHKHDRHECRDCGHNDGAGIIGGIVGGLIASLAIGG